MTAVIQSPPHEIARQENTMMLMDEFYSHYMYAVSYTHLTLPTILLV